MTKKKEKKKNEIGDQKKNEKNLKLTKMREEIQSSSENIEASSKTSGDTLPEPQKKAKKTDEKKKKKKGK